MTSPLEDLIDRVNSSNNDNTPPLTNGEKWWIALFVAIIFFIFASPVAFAITNELITTAGGPRFCRAGGVTWIGLFIHTVIVFFVVRLLLW